MEINYKKGNLKKGDKIILFTSNGKDEAVTIFKLALLINQIAINELIINKDVIEKYNRFWFKEFIEKSISSAENGIDWGLEENKDYIIELCKKYKISYEIISPLLQKTWQTKLEDN